MSSLDAVLHLSNFAFPDHASIDEESTRIQKLIKSLALQKHIEGGYFAETDRDERRVPNPFLTTSNGAQSDSNANGESQGGEDASRAASTSIFYLITPKTPIGYFHRNKGRTVHTLHEGRGRYVLIHPPEGIDAYGNEGHEKGIWRIETFTVGRDVANGERLQWIVDGGIWKTSFLLGRTDGAGECGGEHGEHGEHVDCTVCGGCLISEVCFLIHCAWIWTLLY
jgi:predicted cupin superfamily sugar epimerase